MIQVIRLSFRSPAGLALKTFECPALTLTHPAA